MKKLLFAVLLVLGCASAPKHPASLLVVDEENCKATNSGGRVCMQVYSPKPGCQMLGAGRVESESDDADARLGVLVHCKGEDKK